MTLMIYLTRRARRMLTPRQLDRDVSQWVVQSLARLTATFAIIYGLFTIVGGPIRWSGPSFQTALGFPGAPASWGIFLAAAGSITLAATFTRYARFATVGLGLIASWAILFAFTFLKTWHDRPDASIGGALTTFLIAGFCIVIGAAYWNSRVTR